MTVVAAGPAGGTARVKGEASARLVLPCAPSDLEKVRVPSDRLSNVDCHANPFKSGSVFTEGVCL